MKFRVSLLAALGLVLSFMAGSAMAGPNANAKFLIHLRTSTAHTVPCDDPATAPPSCAAINTQGKVIPPGAPPQIGYLLIEDATEISAMDCGISFTGTDPSYFAWYLCADADTTTNGWASDTGNQIRWDNCKTGTTVVCAGYFYIAAYEPCQLKVVADPISSLATVTDCDTTNAHVDVVSGHDVSHMGYVTFSVGGTAPGYNPCGLVTPVQSVTFSQIKGMYATH